MQGRQKSKMPLEEVHPPDIINMEVVDPYADLESAVNQIIAQVEDMVAKYGDPELSAEFNSRKFVNQWIETYVPALGGKPSRLLCTKEGRAQIQMVLNCSWSGAYA